MCCDKKKKITYPLLGAFIERQMRHFHITERSYKSELSAGSRSYESIKKGVTSV